MNSENSKTYKRHVLIFKLTSRLDLRRGVKMLLYQTLVFITHGKTWKAYIITTNLKYQLQHGMINLNYQMDHILYQVFKIIFRIFQKNIMKRLIIHQ